MPSNIPRRSNIVSDRGPAKYFHGRVRILANFDKLVKDSMKPRGASTFLIQGAPGAGKTALLDVLSKRAKESGWSIAEIDPPALWDPEELSYYLGKGTRAQITSVSGQVGVDAVVKAEGKLDVAVQRHRPTTLKILAAGKRPLLLILDEAQTLGTTNTPPSQELAGVATNVLNSIHNGRLKRPVILLAAGLGMSKASFVGLGILRFKGGCFVELGGLGKDSERAVIKDWLVKEGGAKGDPTPWIDQIAQKTLLMGGLSIFRPMAITLRRSTGSREIPCFWSHLCITKNRGGCSESTKDNPTAKRTGKFSICFPHPIASRTERV